MTPVFIIFCFCFLLPEKDVCFVVAPLRAPEEALLLRTLSLRAIKLRWLYGLFWSFLCDGLSYVYTNVDFLISHVTRCVLRSTLIKWFMYPVLVLTCHFSAEDYCSILIFTWHFTDNWWRRYFFFPQLLYSTTAHLWLVAWFRFIPYIRFFYLLTFGSSTAPPSGLTSSSSSSSPHSLTHSLSWFAFEALPLLLLHHHPHLKSGVTIANYKINDAGLPSLQLPLKP